MNYYFTKYYWILSGILLGLSYPSFTFSTGFLAWAALVPFLLKGHIKSPFKTYLIHLILFGLISLFVQVWWVAHFSINALLICIFTQFFYLVLPLILFYFFYHRIGWSRALLLLPFIWVANDYFAHKLPHGLQINLLPYTQTDSMWLIQFADMTGMWGISFWVIMVNCLIVYFIERNSLLAVIFLVLAFLAPLGYSWYILKINPSSAIGHSTKETKVSLIQTNLDSYSNEKDRGQKTFDQIVFLSDSSVKYTEPDLMVLPESAYPISLFEDSVIFNVTRKAINAWQTSLAIGFLDYPNSSDRNVFKNSSMVFTPELSFYWDSLKLKASDIKVYQKEYGLPFVETMPYVKNGLSFQGRIMEKGDKLVVFNYKNFTGENLKVALSICWEQMYPEKIAALVSQKAEFIVFMNNDSWFGYSPGSKQLLNISRLRAIENRKAIARCSNGGISCFIDPFGNIYGEIPWFKADISTQKLKANQKWSFYTKYPFGFLYLSGILGAILLLVFEVQSKKE